MRKLLLVAMLVMAVVCQNATVRSCRPYTPFQTHLREKGLPLYETPKFGVEMCGSEFANHGTCCDETKIRQHVDHDREQIRQATDTIVSEFETFMKTAPVILNLATKFASLRKMLHERYMRQSKRFRAPHHLDSRMLQSVSKNRRNGVRPQAPQPARRPAAPQPTQPQRIQIRPIRVSYQTNQPARSNSSPPHKPTNGKQNSLKTMSGRGTKSQNLPKRSPKPTLSRCPGRNNSAKATSSRKQKKSLANVARQHAGKKNKSLGKKNKQPKQVKKGKETKQGKQGKQSKQTKQGKQDKNGKEQKHGGKKEPVKVEDPLLPAEQINKLIHKLIGLNHAANFRKDTETCWNYIANLRASSVCSTCSGRSREFFFRNKALMNQKTCQNVLDVCYKPLRQLTFFIITLNLLPDMIGLKSKLSEVVKSTEEFDESLMEGITAHVKTQELRSVAHLFEKLNFVRLTARYEVQRRLEGTEYFSKEKLFDAESDLCTRFMVLNQRPIIVQLEQLFEKSKCKPTSAKSLVDDMQDSIKKARVALWKGKITPSWRMLLAGDSNRNFGADVSVVMENQSIYTGVGVSGKQPMDFSNLP